MNLHKFFTGRAIGFVVVVVLLIVYFAFWG
jgi:uncharacterized membrane protein YukC